MRIKLVKGGQERIVNDAYGLRMVSMGRATVCPEQGPASAPVPVALEGDTPEEAKATSSQSDAGQEPEKGKRKGQRQQPAPMSEVVEDEPGGSDS